MKTKLKGAVGGFLLILGIALVLGAAGLSDLGAASIGEAAIRVVVGGVILIFGYCLLLDEGEKE